MTTWIACAAVALITFGLADPAAARTDRSHRSQLAHARSVRRWHRVHLIRAGLVTAAYVPATRPVRPQERTVPRIVHAVPAGPAVTAAADTRDLWAATGVAGMQPSRPVRTTDAGVRIPEDRFALLFGTERPFRLSTLPARSTGSHVQFENSGYWFTLLDPVPRSWPDTWYDTDAIAIVEQGDGYALLDASFPAEPLSLRVTVAE